jgi:hypothetical protein
MYMDAQARPSLNQSVTLPRIGTIVSTDSIDLLTAIRTTRGAAVTPHSRASPLCRRRWSEPALRSKRS